MSAIIIRKAEPADADLLATLGACTFFDTYAADNTPEDMAEYLAKSFSPQKQAAEIAEAGSTFFIAENELEAQTYTSIWLGVWQQNPRAIAFYQKCGFHIAGTTSFTLGSDVQTDYVMRYDL